MNQAETKKVIRHRLSKPLPETVIAEIRKLVAPCRTLIEAGHVDNQFGAYESWRGRLRTKAVVVVSAYIFAGAQLDCVERFALDAQFLAWGITDEVINEFKPEPREATEQDVRERLRKPLPDWVMNELRDMAASHRQAFEESGHPPEPPEGWYEGGQVWADLGIYRSYICDDAFGIIDEYILGGFPTDVIPSKLKFADICVACAVVRLADNVSDMLINELILS